MSLLDPELHLLIAYALLHFLWLACIPSVLLIIGLCWMPVTSLTGRYFLSITALASLVLLFAVACWLADASRFAEQVELAPSIALSPSSTLRSLTGANETSEVALPSSETAESTNVAANSVESGPALVESSESRDLWFRRVGSWATYVTLAYLFGLTLFALRLIRGYWFSQQLRRRAFAVTEPEVLRLVNRIAKQLVLRTTPAVKWCEQSVVPTVVGVLRPAVLLPVAFTSGVAIEQLEHILLHEITHLRRHDSLVNFLQNVVETVFFFHPLVWWVSGQVRLYRELSCDASVVHSGVDSKRYAATLIDIETRNRAVQGRSRLPVLVAVSSVASRSQLRIRLEQLLGRSTTAPSPSARVTDGESVLVVLMVVGALLLATLRVSNAGQQDPAQSTPVLTDDVMKNQPESIEPLELAGIVVDAEGKPLSGVSVDAWTWHPGDETTTDENGVFRFRPESDNGRSKVEVRWTKSGYSPHYVPQQPVGVEGLVVTLDATTYFEGTVTDVDGSPATGVTVRGAQKDIEADGAHITEVATETTTDESGNYRLYVFPDEYEITIASTVGVVRTEKLRVMRGESLKENIQLVPGVRFEAIVKDIGSDEPFTGLVLSNFMQRQFVGTSDADGRIVIDGMLPGEFEFSVGAGDLIERGGTMYHGNGPLGRWWSPDAKQEWQRYELKPGEFQRNFDDLTFDLSTGMEPVEIFVEQGVQFSGHVYDPEGKPLGGATVAPAKTGSGNSLTGDTRYSVTTKDDGSYFVVMPAGNAFEYNLMAFDGEYSKWRKWGAVARDPFSTEPGQRIADYDFTLTRGATVRGKVAAIDPGEPPRQVRAHPADQHGNRYYDPTIDVQPDGTFELAGLRPGKHYIQVSPFWLAASDAKDGTSVIVEVLEGEVREGIELRATKSMETLPKLESRKQQPVNVPATTKWVSATAGGVIFTAGSKIFSKPCFDDTSMYFGACDGNFYCLDKTDGRLKWKVENLSRVDSSPVLHHGKLFFSSFANKQNWFHAVDAKTGKMLWQKQIDGIGNSDPLIHEGKVLIAAKNHLFSFDSDTGDQLIAYSLSLADAIEPQVATQGSRILVLVSTDYESNDNVGFGTLVCFDAGVETAIWTLTLDGCNFGSLICDEDRCYFGTRDGSFNAVSLSTGTLDWKIDCGEIFVDPQYVWPGSDVLDIGDSVVFTSMHRSLNDPGALTCVDKLTGKRRWLLVNSLGFAYANGLTTEMIVTATLDHRLMQIERASGRVQFIGILPTPPQWQGEYYGVVVDRGFAYVYGADKQVSRFDLSKLTQ